MPCSHLTSGCLFASMSPLDAQNGFRPILCVFLWVAIDAMVNLDGAIDEYADANGKCEHGLTGHAKRFGKFKSFTKLY